MNTLKIILKKSKIGSTKVQRATLTGLGLRKVGSVSVLKDSPETKGMIKKVSHLLEVEEGDDTIKA
ncbi:MAG: 50S ribosomal protein L30 [Thermodesulfobacteriota bacterium]